MLLRGMLSLRMDRFVFLLGVLLFPASLLHAQPEGALSVVKSEGVMLTSLKQPEFFIFQSGTKEEHFDGTQQTMEAQGGIEVGEPITGLHYLRPRMSVDGPAWNDADKRLIDGQFHGAGTGNFYLFKTVEGQLFTLPKEGETVVIRMDWTLKNGRKVTVWARK